MANINSFAQIVRQVEGYGDGVSERYGITGGYITTYNRAAGSSYIVSDMTLLANWEIVTKHNTWDVWNGDLITNQSIANLYIDWAFNSGKSKPNMLTVVGLGTGSSSKNAYININKQVSNGQGQQLFNAIKAARLQYYENLASSSCKDAKNLDGWKNRLAAFKYYN